MAARTKGKNIMAIKMRNNTKSDAVCCECGKNQDNSLGMFDLCIGKNIFTICDACNNELFQKSLKASCYIDNKVKSQHDIALINRRNKTKTKILSNEENKGK